MDRIIDSLLRGEEENYIFPFLWMHGEEEKTIRTYMDVIDRANIRGVCVESRPHPDFCGPGWWRDLDIIVEEAKKRNMKVWILDDSHFPTGFANGAMKTKPDNLCRQSLVYEKLAVISGASQRQVRMQVPRKAKPWTPNMIENYQLREENMRHFDDDRIISITAIRVGGTSFSDILDLTSFAATGEICANLPAGTWEIGACFLTRNRGPHRDYINMMDKDSCRVLIDAVYEPHYQHYREEFGKTIAGFFSDEPELGNGHLYDTGKRIFELDDQPWSAEVEERLKRKWNGRFASSLPLLWVQNFSDSLKAKVRYDFMDTVTKAVQEDFSMQIGSWCRERGVQYIGHLIEDNNQHTRTGSSLGHYFRGLAGMDMAGVDDIGGQVLPQGEWNGPYGMMGEFRNGKFYHYTLGKLASSWAALDPLKQGRSMCEIFGNYGWEEGVRLEKYLTDHFLVRGINHFVPHAFSPKEFPDPDCPPHFYAHGNNPQYRHFGMLMKYTNRMCSLFCNGRHIAAAAILYDAEAEWTGGYMDLEKPGEILYDAQIDYDFIPADVFENRNRYLTRTQESLQINHNTYTMFLIPESQFIPYAAAQAVLELQGTNTKVYFINRLPEACCDGRALPEGIAQCEVVSLENLEKLARANFREILLQPENNRIRCLHYQPVSGNDWYLFVNEGTTRYDGSIQVPTSGSCFQYDAWENKLLRLTQKTVEGGTQIRVCVEPGKSLVVIFDEPNCKLEEPLRLGGQAVRWNQGWTRSTCRSIAYPHFTGEQEVMLPDHLAQEQPHFSGFVRYQKTYACDRVPSRMILEITDAAEGVEAFVNGKSAGIQIAAPYRYDIAPLLRKGENQICLEVATTLEREMSEKPDPVREYLGLDQLVPTCGSGITGEVYYEVPTAAEKETT